MDTEFNISSNTGIEYRVESIVDEISEQTVIQTLPCIGKYFDMHSENVEIIPGTEATFKVVPELHSPAKELYLYDIAVRNCKYNHEQDNDKSIFKEYHTKSCAVECKLKKTINQFKCTPWDIPDTSEALPDCNTDQPI